MTKLRDALQEREKRVNQELNQVRSEKDELLERITGLDLSDSEDLAQLANLIEQLRQAQETRQTQLQKENANILEHSKKIEAKMVEEAVKDKVKLNKKPVDKMAVKKAAYLAPSKVVEQVLTSKQYLNSKDQKLKKK